MQTYIQASLRPTLNFLSKQMCVSERRTDSGLGLTHAFFSNNMAMWLIPQPPECARAC